MKSRYLKVFLAVLTMCISICAHAEGHSAAVQNAPDTAWVRQYHENTISDVAFSADGSLIATTGHDQKINMIHTATGELAWSIPAPTRQFRLAFGANGEGLYSGGLGSEVYLWDATSGEQKRVYTVKYRIESPMLGITDVTPSKDGRYLATSAFYDVIITDLQTGDEVLKFQAPPTQTQPIRGNSVSFTPDGSRIAVGTDFGRMYVLDVQSGAKLDSMRVADIIKGGVRYSPDGTLIAAGGLNKDDGFLLLFDAESMEQKYRLEMQGAVEDIAFSPGGNYVVAASNDGYIYMWDTGSGELIRQYVYISPFGPVEQRSVAVAPDSSHIVSASADDRVYLWNAHWTATGVDEAPSPLQTAAIDPDAAGTSLRVQVVLAAPAAVGAEIADSRGRIVLVQNFDCGPGTQERTISTSSLAQGAYYCRLRVGERSVVLPFTIIR